MVTFTSLRASPLAFAGISDFLCQKPAAVSSAGISSLTSPELLQNFSCSVAHRGSAPFSTCVRGRERRGGFKQRWDEGKRKRCCQREVLHKSVKRKGQNKGINKAQDKVFFLSNGMDVCSSLSFPTLE